MFADATAERDRPALLEILSLACVGVADVFASLEVAVSATLLLSGTDTEFALPFAITTVFWFAVTTAAATFPAMSTAVGSCPGAETVGVTTDAAWSVSHLPVVFAFAFAAVAWLCVSAGFNRVACTRLDDAGALETSGRDTGAAAAGASAAVDGTAVPCIPAEDKVAPLADAVPTGALVTVLVSSVPTVGALVVSRSLPVAATP